MIAIDALCHRRPRLPVRTGQRLRRARRYLNSARFATGLPARRLAHLSRGENTAAAMVAGAGKGMSWN
jgi:hypothetical protein